MVWICHRRATATGATSLVGVRNAVVRLCCAYLCYPVPFHVELLCSLPFICSPVYNCVLQGHAGVSRASGVVGAQLLRATSPEAVIVLDGISYGIGGLVGQGDFAFLNTSLLQNFSADPSAFVFRPPHRTVSATQKRYEWTPGQRHSDANAAWPPSGLSVELDFVAPPSAVAAHAGVVVTVVYEIYTGIPVLSKWLRVSSNATTAVVIDALTMEQLHCTEAAVGYWPQSTDGLLTAGTTTGRVRLSSEFTRDKGSTTKIGPDSRCTTCTQGSGQTVLSSG